MRLGPLQVALCALLLTGCTVGGPQGAGDQAGRQAPSAIPSDVASSTVLSIADRVRASGDLNSAISFYRRAIGIDPHLVPAYIGLGETLLATGYINDAADAFRSAQAHAEDEPPSPERTSHEAAAARGLGLALIGLGQPVPAIEMLNKANGIAPAPRAYSGIGVAEDLLGDSDAADNAYKQGMALAPDDLDLLNNYGLSQALHGNFNDAIATLRHVASDPKANARNRLNLALALGLAGRNEDAAKVARIDLDERSVASNVAFYAMLRSLPAKARANAILRPGAPLPAETIIANCDGSTCPKQALPGEKLAAVPTTPVDQKPLDTSAAAKPTAHTAPAVAKPTSLTPPPPKTDTQPADTIEKKVSKQPKNTPATAMAPSATASSPATKAPLPPAQSAEAPSAEAPPPPMPAMVEPPAPGPVPVPTPATAAAPAGEQPAAPAAAPTSPADQAQPPVKAEAAGAQQQDTPAATADAKPAAKADNLPPALKAEDAQAVVAAPAAPSNDAKPAAKVDDAQPAMGAASAQPQAAPTAPTPAGQDASQPSKESATPSATASGDNGKPSEQVAAAQPPADSAKPAGSDAKLVAAEGHPTLGAMPAAPPTPVTAPSDTTPAEGPVVKAAAVVPPLPPGKHAWIQIASFRNEQNAQAAWKNMTDGNQDLLRYVPLSVRKVDLGTDKGVYYVLRIGPLADLSQARDLCTALKDRQITCVVAK